MNIRPNLSFIYILFFRRTIDSFQKIQNGEHKEGQSTTKGDISHGDLRSKHLTTNNSGSCTQTVTNGGTADNRPVVGTSSHSNGGNLRTVTPFTKEDHNEDLDP
ncbi:hypothetical protein WICPIJ_001362 [Wickerhamomyces pijperi]|uniref:Uncharacterized protein n=1 Tax=Wickerhamomyces pijperi TaxID=599730 RepID=A0A9P8QDF8_WICPI|nr:hypothetical protein WICPIJ_001362 [Wickerhamomyces pijperi]